MSARADIQTKKDEVLLQASLFIPSDPDPPGVGGFTIVEMSLCEIFQKTTFVYFNNGLTPSGWSYHC